jgi:hypothetical protein
VPDFWGELYWHCGKDWIGHCPIATTRWYL